MCGRLTEKADGFAFGVVALEVVSGRPNSYSSSEDETFYLLEWVWHHICLLPSKFYFLVCMNEPVLVKGRSYLTKCICCKVDDQ